MIRHVQATVFMAMTSIAVTGCSSGSSTTVYTFKAMRAAQTSPACDFGIIAPNDVAQGTVQFQFQSAANFLVLSTSKRVSGLGDEAYTDGGAPVVRVGNVQLSVEEDSCSLAVTVALMRKIITHLRVA